MLDWAPPSRLAQGGQVVDAEQASPVSCSQPPQPRPAGACASTRFSDSPRVNQKLGSGAQGRNRPSTRGFSVRRRGRFGARKSKKLGQFPRGRPNRPARPSPCRTPRWPTDRTRAWGPCGPTSYAHRDRAGSEPGRFRFGTSLPRRQVWGCGNLNSDCLVRVRFRPTRSRRCAWRSSFRGDSAALGMGGGVTTHNLF
jgi:hypothetical protein